MRRSLKVLGLASIAGLVVPPIVAAMEKRRIVVVADPEASEVSLATIFAGEDLANRSSAFRGGRSVCWYGAQRLDLRSATLAEDGATLRIRCLFGAVQVLVPETWRVDVQGVPLLGGVQDDSSGPDGEGPLFTIEAACAFGGITIDTQDDDDWIGAPRPEPPDAVAVS